MRNGDSGLRCAQCDAWPKDPDRALKKGFPNVPGAIRLVTQHSYKGWESRHLLVYVNDLRREGDFDGARALYVALTRLLRHERGSSLTVVSSCPELADWGKQWFDEYVGYEPSGQYEHSIDAAIARVLEGNPKVDERSAKDAVVSLGGLRTGHHPFYNRRVVALAYLCQYQLRQVNMAYTLFVERLASSDDWSGGLQLVDFGAGALAGLMGLVLAVADLMRSGVPVGNVFIDCVDESQEMMDVGYELCRQWGRICRDDPELWAVRQALNRVKVSALHRTCASVARRDVGACWVSAFHALYDDSVGEVADAMVGLNTALAPDWMLLTANDSKRDLAERVVSSYPGWSGPQIPEKGWLLAPVLGPSEGAIAGDRLELLPEWMYRRDRMYGYPSNVVYWTH